MLEQRLQVLLAMPYIVGGVLGPLPALEGNLDVRTLPVLANGLVGGRRTDGIVVGHEEQRRGLEQRGVEHLAGAHVVDGGLVVECLQVVQRIVAQGALHSLVPREDRLGHAHRDLGDVGGAVPHLAHEAVQNATIAIHVARHLQHDLAQLVGAHGEAMHHNGFVRLVVLQESNSLGGHHLVSRKWMH